MKVDILESIEGKGLGVEAKCLAQDLSKDVVVISKDTLRDMVNRLTDVAEFSSIRNGLANKVYDTNDMSELTTVLEQFLEMRKIYEYFENESVDSNIEESDDFALAS